MDIQDLKDIKELGKCIAASKGKKEVQVVDLLKHIESEISRLSRTRVIINHVTSSTDGITPSMQVGSFLNHAVRIVGESVLKDI